MFVLFFDFHYFCFRDVYSQVLLLYCCVPSVEYAVCVFLINKMKSNGVRVYPCLIPFLISKFLEYFPFILISPITLLYTYSLNYSRRFFVTVPISACLSTCYYFLHPIKILSCSSTDSNPWSKKAFPINMWFMKQNSNIYFCLMLLQIHVFPWLQLLYLYSSSSSTINIFLSSSITCCKCS